MSLEIAVAAMILATLNWGWNVSIYSRQIKLMKDMIHLQEKINNLNKQVWKKG